MHVLLIVNATASSVTARRRVVIQKALGADHDLEVAETHRRGHASRLARAAALDGTEVVVVLAGDGTLNEAADGLAGSDTALAALPGGSTNVYARTIGVENDPIDATSQLIAALDRKSFKRIGLGSADSRRFLFHLGIGFDAEVIHWVERRPGMKRFAAHPWFVVAACSTWLHGYDRQRNIRFADANGELGSGPFAIISKTTPYTYLNARPLNVSPAATLDSPLALAMFRTIRLTSLLPLTASALRSGKLAQRHPQLLQQAPITELEITDDKPFPWQVDGDYLGETDRLSVRYEPDALTLVLP